MFTYLLCGDLFGAVIVLLFCFHRVSLRCVAFFVFLSAVLCSSCFSPLCCVLRVSLRCVAFFVFLSAVLRSSCFSPLCCVLRVSLRCVAFIVFLSAVLLSDPADSGEGRQRTGRGLCGSVSPPTALGRNTLLLATAPRPGGSALNPQPRLPVLRSHKLSV